MGLAVNDVVSIRFQGTLFDQIVINTFNYEVITATTVIPTPVQDLTTICSAINAGVGTNLYAKWKLCVPANVENDFVIAQRIEPTRTIAVKQAPLNVVNGRADCQVPNLSAVITRGTDEGQRGQVGSIHIPGVADADIAADGNLDVLIGAALETLAAEMLSNISFTAGALVVRPVLFHPTLKDQEGHIIRSWFTTPLTRAFHQPQVRVMRRRTIGVGK